MRTIVLLSLFVSFQASALTCGVLESGKTIPVDAQAKKLTKVLGLKTCDSKRFNAYAQKLGLKVDIVEATPAQEQEYLLGDFEKVSKKFKK